MKKLILLLENMPKIQQFGTSAFIYKDRKVLMVKRSKTITPFPMDWEIPGGKIKFGEDAEDALKRGVKEEVGMKIKNLIPYSTFSYAWKKIHQIDIHYICQPLNDKIKLSEEHSEYLWATKNEVKKLKMTERIRKVILKGFDFIK